MQELNDFEGHILEIKFDYSTTERKHRNNTKWQECSNRLIKAKVKAEELIKLHEYQPDKVKNIIKALKVVSDYLERKYTQLSFTSLGEAPKLKKRREEVISSSSESGSETLSTGSEILSTKNFETSTPVDKVEPKLLLNKFEKLGLSQPEADIPIIGPEIVIMDRFDIVNKRVIANVPIFNGGVGTNVRGELKIFLDNCQFIIDSLQDTDDDRGFLLAGVKSRFRGDAYELVNKSNPTTYALLRTLLTDTYAPERTLAEVSRTLYACRQSTNETTRCYLRKLKNHLADIKALLVLKFPANNVALIAYQEQEAMDIFKRGIKNANLRQHLLLSEALTLNDLGIAAMVYEEAERKLFTGSGESNQSVPVNMVLQEYNKNYSNNNYQQDQSNNQRDNQQNRATNQFRRNDQRPNFGNQFQDNYQRNDSNNQFRNNYQQFRNNNQFQGNYRQNYPNDQFQNIYPRNPQYNQVQHDYSQGQNNHNFRNNNYQGRNQYQGFNGNNNYSYNNQCNLCGNKGHNKANCALNFKMDRNWDHTEQNKQTSPPDRLHEPTIFCEGCGLAGHKADQCPTLKQVQNNQTKPFSGNESVQIKSANLSAQ